MELKPAILWVCVNYAETPCKLCTYSFSQFDITLILNLKQSYEEISTFLLWLRRKTKIKMNVVPLGHQK